LQKLIFPGSFDPITLGHLDIIKRAAKTFPYSNIIVAVAFNQDKKHFFSGEERLSMIEKSIKEINLENVEVVIVEGIVSKYILENDINIVIRSFRNNTDIENERIIESFTKKTANVETIFFTTEPEHSTTSSSLVRLLVSSGFVEKIEDIVPTSVFKCLMENTCK